jgi:A1 cistron-splicing factor AAR2
MFQKEGVDEIFDKLQEYASIITKPSNSKRSDSLEATSLVIKDPDFWRRLTSSIKGAALTKITGHQWNKWQVSSTHDFKPAIPTISDEANPNKTRDEVLRFIFPKSLRFWTAESVGRDRTEQALDSSSHVLSVIQDLCTYEDSDEIIGEIQFCYITGMLLGNLACMEHWAHVVKVRDDSKMACQANHP